MQDTNLSKPKYQDELESPQTIKSSSLMNFKVCPFSPSKISELSAHEEETSTLFNQSPIRKISLFNQIQKTDSDIDPNSPSPNPGLVNQLIDLKNQILNLKVKFSNHQEDIGGLVGENMYLKSKIIQLQENLLNMSEMSSQNKSKCSCIIT